MLYLPGFLKRCTKCGEFKLPTTEFFFRKARSANGQLFAHCKLCDMAKTKGYVRKKKYVYHQTRDKEEQRVYSRHYYTAHRAEKLARNRLNRALRCAAPGNHTAADVRRQYEAQKGRCYYCNKAVGDTYDVDHVIPLSRGGSNGPENIVIACPECNGKKKDKLPHEWPDGGRLL